MSELQVGNEIWMCSHCDDWKAYSVIGFSQPEFNRISVWAKTDDGKTGVTHPDLPYVAMYNHNGDSSWNSNNYVQGSMTHIKPRK